MRSRSVNTNLLAVVACLLWSTAFVGIKIGLAYTTPLRFAGIRFFIAGAVLLPFAGGVSTLASAVRDHWRYIAVISLLSTVMVYSLFYLGISMGSASTTAIVVGGGPLFVAVMAHLFMPDDKLTVRKGLSLLLGFFGIWSIAASRYHDEAGGRAFWAVLLLVGSNISGGLGNILIAKSRRDIKPLLLSAVQLALGGVVLYCVSLFAEPPSSYPKPAAYYGALIYLSALSAAAMTIWFWLLRQPQVKVSEINLWKFLIPVVGAVLSWTVLGNESPDKGQIFGMITIAAALVWMHYRRCCK